jgi:hypothetical protein
VKKQ